MKTSQRGIELIKRYEGLRLKPYLCPAGIPTIGYGHTGDVTMQSPAITAHQAEAILDFDLDRFEEGVSNATRAITLQQYEFDALVSFAFNLGTQALLGSTLLKKLLKGDHTGAADEFAKWNHTGKTENAGLTKRRAEEATMFRGLV